MSDVSLSDLETLLKSTQGKVEKLEEHISDLSNKFPVDINFRISRIRKLISQAEHRKSFLDDFEEPPALPEVNDQEYIKTSLDKVYNELITSFQDIDKYQTKCIEKFVREHPGPYYIPRPKKSNFPIERYKELKSQLQIEKEEVNKRISQLNEKLSRVASNNDSNFSATIKQMNKDIDNQSNEMRELMELQSTLKLSLLDAISKIERTNTNDKIDPNEDKLRRINMEALASYRKQDAKLDMTYSTLNTVSLSITNEINDINSIMKSISIREESIKSVLDTYSPIVEKASIKCGQIQNSIEESTTNIENIKKNMSQSQTNEMLGELTQKCQNCSDESKAAISEAKDIVKQTVDEFDKNNYPI
ncbi:hypothetical protein TVAG_256750 [Trichomonas vaginalis G3]|uniref:Uncharacterized protein n=1 Tax=Trichomonas vaginalis (strain ATCC PRA-98 / G3) TaxID=412133 RepID=A2FEY1_TRIV3|nr:hypothetical protein TVAGG3_0046910 [Trichomonas vaginalis G3]EAX96535.1 hypothetical protein TVAG_256750 [Trichomonas vaginalis G3]KAI5541097.1 hypothetical protein TVAGG3_0046910 [Trichomonas vaginalis G3]|eukprot:XP_001309465.1 hypothetical protein [Trichomonas vaginalis G3]